MKDVGEELRPSNKRSSRLKVGLWLTGLLLIALSLCMAWDQWAPDQWARLHTYPNSCNCRDCQMRNWPGYILPAAFHYHPGYRNQGFLGTDASIGASAALGSAFILAAMFGERVMQRLATKLVPRVGRCQCGYDLRGLLGDRCPECGKRIGHDV